MKGNGDGFGIMVGEQDDAYVTNQFFACTQVKPNQKISVGILFRHPAYIITVQCNSTRPDFLFLRGSDFMKPVLIWLMFFHGTCGTRYIHLRARDLYQLYLKFNSVEE